jgi:hypothetical protein
LFGIQHSIASSKRDSLVKSDDEGKDFANTVKNIVAKNKDK